MPENTTERDQLAALLRDHGAPIPDEGYPADEYDCCAAAILAAGWRPPARVIETPEELDELPNGTVILDDNEEFHRLNPYGMDEDRTWFPAWLSGNASAQDFGQTPKLPARVVHIPAEEDGRA